MDLREENDQKPQPDRERVPARRMGRWIALCGRSVALIAVSWFISQPATERLVQSLIIALVLGMIGEPFGTLFL